MPDNTIDWVIECAIGVACLAIAIYGTVINAPSY